jgi:hypothetical protein
MSFLAGAGGAGGLGAGGASGALNTFGTLSALNQAGGGDIGGLGALRQPQRGQDTSGGFLKESTLEEALKRYNIPQQRPRQRNYFAESYRRV